MLGNIYAAHLGCDQGNWTMSILIVYDDFNAIPSPYLVRLFLYNHF
jgi:hypothetical protein